MGKVREPKTIMLDACFVNTPEYLTLVEQGHSIKIMGTEGVDLIISPARYTAKRKMGTDDGSGTRSC